MKSLRSIAERRILHAMREGHFDNLALKGKPLPRDDYLSVSEDLRLGYKILRNAGVLPPELELRKEILALQELIQACGSEGERHRLRRKLRYSKLKYDLLMEQ